MLGGEKARFDGGDDAFGYLILNGEEIRELEVVALRPNLAAGRGIAQSAR